MFIYFQCNNPWSEMVRLKLSYNEACNEVTQLQIALADVEGQTIPGHMTSDKDRSVNMTSTTETLPSVPDIPQILIYTVWNEFL